MEFNLACDIRLRLIENEKKHAEKIVDLKNHNLSTMAAFAGQPLEFDGEDSLASIPEAP